MTDPKYLEAKKRVKAKKDFFSHLGTYLVMGTFFFLLNAVTSFGNWWFYWPMLGWGLAVLFHYVDVFGIPGIEQGAGDWEERELEKELRRLGGTGKPDRSEHIRDLEDHLDLPDLQEKRPEKEPAPRKVKRWDESDLV